MLRIDCDLAGCQFVAIDLILKIKAARFEAAEALRGLVEIHEIAAVVEIGAYLELALVARHTRRLVHHGALVRLVFLWLQVLGLQPVYGVADFEGLRTWGRGGSLRWGSCVDLRCLQPIVLLL